MVEVLSPELPAIIHGRACSEEDHIMHRAFESRTLLDHLPCPLYVVILNDRSWQLLEP